MDYWLVPLVSMLIGWGTNVIAVKLMFFPLEEKRLLFFKIQGLIPRKRLVLEEKVAQTIEENFLNGKDIHKMLDNEVFRHEVMKGIKRMVGRITSKLPELLRKSVEGLVERYLERNKEEIFKEIFKGIENSAESINVKERILKNMRKIETKTLNDIVFKTMKKEFRQIELIGGIIGLVIGVIQVVVLRF